MNDRRVPTTIMVQPIKVDSLEAQALAYVHEEGKLRKAIAPDATSCKASYKPHGFVETPKGIYAFENEGVGNSEPITNTAKYKIDFYPETDHGNGKYTMSMMPACSISLGPEEMKSLADGEPVNLATFIRSFGAQLDGNYETWRRLLETAMKQAVAS